VKTGVRLGVNVSPEPVSNIIASVLEDLTVAGMVVLALLHPVPAAVLAAILLAAGAVLAALLARRIRRAWRERREQRALSRAAGNGSRRPARPGTGATR
jgi:membrane protein implicated in regulation of membrane protease activity